MLSSEHRTESRVRQKLQVWRPNGHQHCIVVAIPAKVLNRVVRTSWEPTITKSPACLRQRVWESFAPQLISVGSSFIYVFDGRSKWKSSHARKQRPKVEWSENGRFSFTNLHFLLLCLSCGWTLCFIAAKKEHVWCSML